MSVYYLFLQQLYIYPADQVFFCDNCTETKTKSPLRRHFSDGNLTRTFTLFFTGFLRAFHTWQIAGFHGLRENS